MAPLAILAFQLLLGNPYFANILGFLFGGGVGYLAHAGYTFKARFSKRNFMGYTLIWLAGVGFNLLLNARMASSLKQGTIIYIKGFDFMEILFPSECAKGLLLQSYQVQLLLAPWLIVLFV